MAEPVEISDGPDKQSRARGENLVLRLPIYWFPGKCADYAAICCCGKSSEH
eukprot:CAMPEP_0167781886 /NCGR_PEP_ID=MMETSP0111_2-20121227/6197_1 /TAXON_ID=91324 /ORGANISM="Lotharella globosa, Strain CCCM811" /LENGTH=50 /DNA_ID=CAMNT_0007672629 /DNA_START=788 /DNA_END=940 /DNA_ORIENTATION=-